MTHSVPETAPAPGVAPTAAAEVIDSRSPQRPDEVVATAPAATTEDVARAARAARLAQRDWWAAAPADRAAALSNAASRLRRMSDEATELVVREVGKPVAEARGEVARAAAILDFYAQACFAPLGDTFPAAGAGLSLTQRRPHGVAGLITPWNFPLAIPLWKAAPALAAGNGVLLKPSPEAIGCAALLARVCADLPDGLLRVLPGGAQTGQAVTAHADVVSFTGSVGIGQRVVADAAARGRPVQAEMGGQNAAVVLPDADLAATAAMLAGAMMGYAGQKCTATRRVIAVGDPAPLTEALTEAVRALSVGDPADPGVTVGPVISSAAHRAVADAVASAVGAGARLLTDGPDAAGSNTGWLARPVLLDRVDPDHPVARTETFGPLAVVLSAPDVDAAMALANGVPHGLVTSVHGRDLAGVLAAVQTADTGLIRVNAPTTGVDFYMPFGGTKASSYGPREQGMSGVEFFSATRTVTIAQGS